MKLISRKVFSLLVALLLALSLLPLGGASQVIAAGTISLTTTGTAYLQDFDTLVSTVSADASTLPTGWEMLETGTNANTAYTASTGSANGGDTYSFGAAASTERAFGTLLSGTLTSTIGAQFTNNTDGLVVGLNIAYTGEQWRLGASGRADRLDFQYSLDATSLNSGTWTDFNALDFSSPVTTGTVGLLDGNISANQDSLSETVNGLNIADGASFWIRWSDFNTTGSDDGLGVDNFSITPVAGEDHAPFVMATDPVGGALDVYANQVLSITFSEPVDLAASWYTFSCMDAETPTLTQSGGPTTYLLTPDTALPKNTHCNLSIDPAKVTDLDKDVDAMEDSFDLGFTVGSLTSVCEAPFTAIPTIQGSGLVTPLSGSVTTQGVVVGDFEGASPTMGGFYIQDAVGDSDAATSDGIFVYNPNQDVVTLGNVVRVTGTVEEKFEQTQLSTVSIVACGSGQMIAPVDVNLPVPSATALEAYEGMLVRFPQTLYVTDTYGLGRYGQVTLSANGRLMQPTTQVMPGTAAADLQAANNLNQIIIDDSSSRQNPETILLARGGNPLSASNTLRGGDTLTGMTGVLNYSFSAYRINPIGSMSAYYNFEPANPRPTEAPQLDGDLRVSAFNTLNYFNTWDGLPDVVDNCAYGVGGAASDCRGADTELEFERQAAKTVAAILKLNVAVLGVNEIENDGYGPTSAIADLTARLNAATAPGTYAFIDVDAVTGQTNALGVDAIKVGLIYQPALISLAGETAVLNTEAFVNGGDPAARNRAALAQAFEDGNGNRFIMVVNHLKSKGSACSDPDSNDGQANCSVVRTNAVNVMADWLDSDPTATGASNILIMGDLNSYTFEDPILALEAAGYTNLIRDRLGLDAYSYSFGGQWGYLDHALASDAFLTSIKGVAHYHINSDEPTVFDYNTDFKSAAQIANLYVPDEYRTSDHDATVIGIGFNHTPQAGDVLANQVAYSGIPFSVVLPASSFTDSDADALTYSATLGDGSPLPAWLHFDPITRTFSGTPAYSDIGLLTIKVMVSDAENKTASQTFTLRVFGRLFMPVIFSSQ